MEKINTNINELTRQLQPSRDAHETWQPCPDAGQDEWMEIDRKEKYRKKTSKIEIIQISIARSNENESRSKQ
jgi:hypothetical protein